MTVELHMKHMARMLIQYLVKPALLALPLIAGMSSAAYASLSIDTCAPGYQPWDFTVKIVACIENSVFTAVGSMMGGIQGVMQPVAGAMFTLAVAVAGIRVVSGEKVGRSVVYSIRLAVVALLIFNMGSIAGAIFAIEGELISIVAGGSPWGMIDNFLGNLLGFGPALVLFQGIIGIIGSALTNNSIGVMLFGAGFTAIGTLLKFIFNVVYTYLSCIIMLGFLLVITPIFMPFAVFFITERYVRKVFDMVVSIMLMPILLFAFINLFLNIFDVLISDIFDSVLPQNRDFRSLWHVNNPVLSWLMPGDSSLATRMNAIQQASDALPDTFVPPVQTNVNPFLRHGFNAGLANLPSLNFGPSEPIWLQTLVMRFVALWLFASVMKNMVDRIPEISSSIAGSVIGIPISATDPGQVLKNVQSNAELGLAGAIGGAAGGELGAAAANAAGGNARDQRLARQAGGVLGAVSGMMVNQRRGAG